MDKDYGFGGWGIVILIALFFLLFAVTPRAGVRIEMAIPRCRRRVRRSHPPRGGAN